MKIKCSYQILEEVYGNMGLLTNKVSLNFLFNLVAPTFYPGFI